MQENIAEIKSEVNHFIKWKESNTLASKSAVHPSPAEGEEPSRWTAASTPCFNVDLGWASVSEAHVTVVNIFPAPYIVPNNKRQQKIFQRE